MRKVVENENLMYNGLATSTDPREFIGALKDYLEFITSEGTVALDGLRGEFSNRENAIKSIQRLFLLCTFAIELNKKIGYLVANFLLNT